MIIGDSKKEVINNIKKNIENNELNKKVEIGDPNLSEDEIQKYINDFYKNKKKLSYFFKNKIANKTVKKISKELYPDIKINGLEKLDLADLSNGAIITSNHFNPLDSYNIRKIVEEKLHKKLYIVVQDTNLAMPGFLGFLFNNIEVIPLSKSPNYIIKKFVPELKKILSKGDFILIYPEAGESVKSDSRKMAEVDYEARKKAYEDAYNKKLNYAFDISDIAGWKDI